LKQNSTYILQTILCVALAGLVNCSSAPPPSYEPSSAGGCSSDSDDSASLKLNNGFKLKDPTWDDDIEEIFDTYCFECHAGDTSPNLTKFSTVKQEKKAIIAEMIDSDDMPPSDELDEDELQLVEDWFDADMPESASNEDEDEDSSNDSSSSKSSKC